MIINQINEGASALGVLLGKFFQAGFFLGAAVLFFIGTLWTGRVAVFAYFGNVVSGSLTGTADPIFQIGWVFLLTTLLFLAAAVFLVGKAIGVFERPVRSSE